MKEVIISLLGEYTPRTFEDGTPIGGLASLDYEWIVGAVLFVVAFIGTILILRTLLHLVFKSN